MRTFTGVTVEGHDGSPNASASRPTVPCGGLTARAPGLSSCRPCIGAWTGAVGDPYLDGWEARGRTGFDGRLWFSASPVVLVGAEYVAVDVEVWSSDGTAAGTAEAVDVAADGSSFPRDLVQLEGRLLFTADDGLHGRELWSLRLH